MPFKKNEDGSLALAESGLPIFVGPDGSETPYDPGQKATRIAELTEKAAKRKNDLEKAQASLALLGDVEDIGAFVTQAKANAETVASLADKERNTEAAVQKRINEAVKAAVTPVATERDTLKGELAKTTEDLHRAVIGNAFLNSRYAAEKLKNPALAERLFAASFAVKDGKPIGRDSDGNELYSADGVASFDEALHTLVSTSLFKDDLLKPSVLKRKKGQSGMPPEFAELTLKNMPDEVAMLCLPQADMIYIVNNVEYILTLEPEWFVQAPSGVIGLFLQRVKTDLVRMEKRL